MFILSLESTSRLARRVRPASSKFFADSSTETESTDTLDNIRISKFGMASYNDSFSTSSSDGCESSDSKTFAPKKSYHKKHSKKRYLTINLKSYSYKHFSSIK